MCDRNKGQTPRSGRPSASPLALALAAPPDLAAGSRRRRLWELDDHAHCPLVGVCLPVPVLRRIAGKTMPAWQALDEYDLHCAIVTASKTRSIVAEAAQKELDQRFATTVRVSTRLKSTQALAEHWQSQVHGEDLAGTLWAGLTHPRCTPELEKHMLGQVHMLQHQVGMAARVDMAAHDALQAAHAQLSAHHAALQERQARQNRAHTLRHDQLSAETMRLRAELIARDTALAAARNDLAELRAGIPQLKTREALGRQCELLQARVDELDKALRGARDEADRERRRADALQAATGNPPSPALDSSAQRAGHGGDVHVHPIHPILPDLHARSVLCVGGRTAIVPIYRQLVERSGGRFLHHDGGEEHSAASLDATLTAADLVICQTGCISHNAYWRVKDHCKRTGKRCVFTDSPSMSGLRRALDDHAKETK